MNSIENTGCVPTGNMPTKNDEKQGNDIIGISGIYKIINKVNGKYYVGSSENINGKRGRWFWHLHRLNKNKHRNKHLQNAWNKYGKENWEWVIIEQVDPSMLFEKEQPYLDICKNYPDTNYNFSYDATRPALGYKHSFKTLQKMSIAKSGSNNPMYGRSHSSETKQKVGQSLKGKNKGRRHYMWGKHMSEDQKHKISVSGNGQKRTLETRLNIGKSLKGRVFSEEHRRKLREARLRYVSSSAGDQDFHSISFGFSVT